MAKERKIWASELMRKLSWVSVREILCMKLNFDKTLSVIYSSKCKYAKRYLSDLNLFFNIKYLKYPKYYIIYSISK